MINSTSDGLVRRFMKQARMAKRPLTLAGPRRAVPLSTRRRSTRRLPSSSSAATRKLRAQVGEIHKVGVGFLGEVTGHHLVGVLERFGVPDKNAAGIKRSEQKLVRVQGNGIRVLKRLERPSEPITYCRQCTVGAIDVQPVLLLRTKVCDRFKRFDRAGSHRSSEGHHAEWRKLIAAVLRHAVLSAPTNCASHRTTHCSTVSAYGEMPLGEGCT